MILTVDLFICCWFSCDCSSSSSPSDDDPYAARADVTASLSSFLSAILVVITPPPPLSSLALIANSLNSFSLFSLSVSTCLFFTKALILTSSLAFLSAKYKLSLKVAKFVLIVVSSRNPLPSAASRLSNGIVYPLVFFQLDIHAGTFQLSRSSLVNFSGGACKTGVKSSAGPGGAFSCLCLGGIIGSNCLGTICIIRLDAAAALYPGAFGFGV
mmetsp:Transcript_14379/g.17484  ORF Transcript_14379/g.17484 Transcript_14379/m.17484 type:complete len:213 (+) Transcript_14379:672-1310(+)